MKNHFFKKVTEKLKKITLKRIRILLQSEKKLMQEVTIISNNCLAGFLYKEFDLPFNSPTINLFFSDEDFIKFCSNLDYYLNIEIEGYETERCPIGVLDDIKIFFLHYKNFDEAKLKWEERKKRIKKEKLFIIMTDTKECDQNILNDFDKILAEEKLFLTCNEALKSDFKFLIKGFHKKRMGFMWDYCGITGKKYYDQFDFYNWFKNK